MLLSVKEISTLLSSVHIKKKHKIKKKRKKKLNGIELK